MLQPRWTSLERGSRAVRAIAARSEALRRKRFKVYQMGRRLRMASITASECPQLSRRPLLLRQISHPLLPEALAGKRPILSGFYGSKDVLLISIAFEAACSRCSDTADATGGDNPLMAYQPPKGFPLRCSDISSDVLWA